MLGVARGAFKVLRRATLNPRDSSFPFDALERASHSESRFSALERTQLASLAALASVIDPYRGIGVAVLGETTGETVLKALRDEMKKDVQGETILKERTRTIDFEELEKRNFAENTLGKLLKDHRIGEERSPVNFIKDFELAFVMRRYRELHDIIHALTGFPVTVAGELALKWYECAATRLPMTTLASVGGLLRVEPGSQQLLREWIPWSATAGRRGRFYLAIPFQSYLHYDVDEFRQDVMRWPKLPDSLTDKKLMTEHYKAALYQVNSEARDATALRQEAEERGINLEESELIAHPITIASKNQLS